jgi:flavin reductase (DIM6/NTAB) family NADH-FMN oxidoreductase RutF
MNFKEMKSISVDKFMVKVNDLWSNQWFLLTSGDYKKKHHNTMTVGWGFFGIMWNKPVAVVVVRPTRYTYEFINQYETFTLCAFDKEYDNDLLLLGNKSGRNGDKIAETKLNIIPSKKVSAPSFQEAELIIECKKIYWDDFKPVNFLDNSIEQNYPQKDYHRFFFGEIMEIRGTDRYM